MNLAKKGVKIEFSLINLLNFGEKIQKIIGFVTKFFKFFATVGNFAHKRKAVHCHDLGLMALPLMASTNWQNIK